MTSFEPDDRVELRQGWGGQIVLKIIKFKVTLISRKIEHLAMNHVDNKSLVFQEFIFARMRSEE